MTRGLARRLLGAAACLGAATLTYLFFVGTTIGQRGDAAAFALGSVVDTVPLGPLLGLARTGLVLLLTVAATVLGALALARRRAGTVGACVLVVAATVALTHYAKDWLPRPQLGDFAYDYNTFPSGHAGATAALALVLVTLWPPSPPVRRLRTWAVVVVMVAGAVSVASFAHRPSDIAASTLVAAAFGSLLLPPGPTWSSRTRRLTWGATITAVVLYASYALPGSIPADPRWLLAPTALLLVPALLLFRLPVTGDAPAARPR